MRNWLSLAVIAAVILAIAAVALFRHRGNGPAISSKEAVPKEVPAPPANGSGGPPPPQAYGQISLKDRTREEAVKLWLDRIERDHKADWKTPITFYGRVVNEQMQPVPDAQVHFQWTDLSTKGSSEANAVTDSKGSFAFQGVKGKRLEVSVTKSGYYNSYGMSKRSFEFSNPGEEIYYEPDPSNPPLFRLQKKGAGEKLIKKSVRVIAPGDGSVMTVDLNTGQISAGGGLQIQTWKPSPPRPVIPHYDWKAVLKMADGGFADAPEEFAFEAPPAGYQESHEFSMPANAADWNTGIEKDLYFEYGSPPKYGRLHVQTNATSRYVFINYVVNPSGSRNLEDAAAANSAQTTHP